LKNRNRAGINLYIGIQDSYLRKKYTISSTDRQLIENNTYENWRVRQGAEPYQIVKIYSPNEQLQVGRTRKQCNRRILNETRNDDFKSEKKSIIFIFNVGYIQHDSGAD
jgi:hypothetical protein